MNGTTNYLVDKHSYLRQGLEPITSVWTLCPSYLNSM